MQKVGLYVIIIFVISDVACVNDIHKYKVLCHSLVALFK